MIKRHSSECRDPEDDNLKLLPKNKKDISGDPESALWIA
jgi:hypothetical protein